MRIAVVGAGTAGWVTASAIKRNNPQIDVTIIHDPKLKTIGVGESLVWNMPSFFHDILGIKDPREWMKRSNAVFKTGVKWNNFTPERPVQYTAWAPDLSTEWLYQNDHSNDSFVQHLFNKSKFTDKGSLLQVWLKLYSEGKHKEILKEDFVEGLSPNHWFGVHERSIIGRDGEWLTNPLNGHSYHYDAERVGTVMAELVGKPSGVVERIARVVEILTKDDSITGLKLDDGETFIADMYIDCTGFGRLLVKELSYEWIQSDELTNNCALVKPMYYDGTRNRGRYVHSTTSVTAHSSGWGFEVPLRHRTGNGYVFCSNVTPDIDKIADEFAAFTGPRQGNEPDSPRLIKWNPGRYKQLMVGNCMALGLSWGFIDPFGATNLLATTNMLTHMNKNGGSLRDLSHGAMSMDMFREVVNKQGAALWAHVDVRVKAAFRLSDREDTHYWKTMKQAGIDENIKQHVIDYFNDVDRMNNWGTSSMLHHYMINAMRNNIPMPTPKINVSAETEKLFVEYYKKCNDTYKQKAMNSMPLSEFYDFYYSDDFPNKGI
jgi:tryptophan halogenase